MKKKTKNNKLETSRNQENGMPRLNTDNQKLSQNDISVSEYQPSLSEPNFNFSDLDNILRESRENIFSSITNFKKGENNYLDIFQLKEKYDRKYEDYVSRCQTKLKEYFDESKKKIDEFNEWSHNQEVALEKKKIQI